jgi:hypothetical protein
MRIQQISMRAEAEIAEILLRSQKYPRKNEEAARQLGGLFFQGRIVQTEAKPSKLSEEIL